MTTASSSDCLQALHILGPDGRLLATTAAVVTGLTYNFLPFMVLPLYASLERIDRRLIEAGGDLFAGPFTTFRTVTLPLSMPGVVAGTLLTFIPAAGDYINAELLGTPKQRMIGNDIQRLFAAGAYPTAAALSVTLMAAIVVLVLRSTSAGPGRRTWYDHRVGRLRSARHLIMVFARRSSCSTCSRRSSS